MAECLHCQINELIKAHLENDDPVDLNDLVARIVESAAELIADVAPEEEQAGVLAAAISHLGHSYLEKSGAFGEESTARH
jgi:regulator of sirC expression with transglutaminase-like and TPR domain